jgi:hypothetical protein
VLRIGFLADDYIYLLSIHTRNLGLRLFVPDRTWFFYRPLGNIFTWFAGVHLWGDVPFYYHAVSLIAHALTALILGLWISDITSRRRLGILSGLVFAAYPLHLEAVGWIAAQWDVLAACFGLLSAWLYTRWCLRVGSGAHRRWWLYALAVLSYGVALFTKESVLTLPALFLLAGVLASPGIVRRHWKLLSLSMLPFAALVALNLLIRWLYWGNFGSYPDARTDFTNFFWDNSITALHMLLSPVNTELSGTAVAQFVGAATMGALFFGLALFGRDNKRAITLAFAWLVVTVLPIVNLPLNLKDLQQNRLLYLPAIGYCLLVAALLHGACESMQGLRLPGRWRHVQGRALAYGGVAVLLFASILFCWRQLGPWQVTTVQVEHLSKELVTLIPRQPGPGSMTWYIQNVPDTYKGAYLMRIGIEGLRYYTTREQPAAVVVRDATKAPLAEKKDDSFAMSFDYTKEANLFYVNYIAGITQGKPATDLGASEGGPVRLWDFADCAPEALDEWEVSNPPGPCQPGGGIAVAPGGNISYLLDPAALPGYGGERFLRVRTAMRYPQAEAPGSVFGQWSWAGAGDDFTDERSRTVPVRQDGRLYVYWTFLPLDELNEGGDTVRLRYAPVDAAAPSTVEWIAMDVVP